MKKSIIILITSLIFVISCSEETTTDADINCSVRGTSSYSIGVDPGANFNETNVARASNGTFTDCPGTVVESNNSVISRAQRSSGTLTFTTDEGTADEYENTYFCAGYAVDERQVAGVIDGCNVTITEDGTMSSVTNEIAIDMEAQFSGNCSALVISVANSSKAVSVHQQLRWLRDRLEN